MHGSFFMNDSETKEKLMIKRILSSAGIAKPGSQGIIQRSCERLVYRSDPGGLWKNQPVLRCICDRRCGYDPENACQEALEQIEEKKYAEGLKRRGMKKVSKYGIAFREKECIFPL